MQKGVKKIGYKSGEIDKKKSTQSIIVALASKPIVFEVKEWDSDTNDIDKAKGVTWMWKIANRNTFIGKLHADFGKNFQFTIPPSLCGPYA